MNETALETARESGIIVVAREESEVQQAIEARCLRTGGTDTGIGVVFKDEYLQIRREPVAFPSGAYGTYLTMSEGATKDGFGGVVIVGTLHGNIGLVRQYRFPTRQWSLELPRGGADPDLTALQLAEKEILEELGMTAVKLRHIGTVQTNNGISDSRCAVVHAELDAGSGPPNPEKTEAFAQGYPRYFAKEEVMQMIRKNEVSDMFSLAALAMWLIAEAQD